MLVAGCAHTPTTDVDLELVVSAPLPAVAETVRICVADGPVRELGAARGSYAVAGLPDQPEVTVDVRDVDERVIARAGPVWVVEPATVDLTDCVDCSPCSGGQPVPDGQSSWTLGVRFIE